MSRKLVKFLIMFDNSNLLFFPGQFLSGRVIVEVEEDMAVLGRLRQESAPHAARNVTSIREGRASSKRAARLD